MNEHRTRIACVCAGLLMAASPSTLLAQTGDAWLVLPVAVGEELPAAARELAGAAETALTDRSATVVGPRAFPNLGSEPQALPPEFRERLTSAVMPALEDAAYGRRARVGERINPLLEEVGRYLDALGNDPAAARAVADLALIAARVHVENHDEPAARASVERLLSFVRNPDPTVDYHRHGVLSLLSRVRSRLRENGSDAQLRIGADESNTCNAYVNGQLAGPTPITVPVYSGDYAVRVQCGRIQSRVHVVHVDTGETAVELSPSLEAAVRLEPRLHLRYPDAAALAARARNDAARLAHRLDATHLVLVRADGSEARLEALRREGGEVGAVLGRASVALPPSDDLDATWAALFESGAAPAPAPAAASSLDEPHFANWIIGGALIAGGIASLISPIHTLATLDECADAQGLPPGLCRSAVSFGAQSGVLTAIGVAAIAGGAVFLLVAPLRVDVAASPTSARLTLTGQF